MNAGSATRGDARLRRVGDYVLVLVVGLIVGSGAAMLIGDTRTGLRLGWWVAFGVAVSVGVTMGLVALRRMGSRRGYRRQAGSAGLIGGLIGSVALPHLAPGLLATILGFVGGAVVTMTLLYPRFSSEVRPDHNSVAEV